MKNFSLDFKNKRIETKLIYVCYASLFVVKTDCDNKFKPAFKKRKELKPDGFTACTLNLSRTCVASW